MPQSRIIICWVIYSGSKSMASTLMQKSVLTPISKWPVLGLNIYKTGRGLNPGIHLFTSTPRPNLVCRGFGINICEIGVPTWIGLGLVLKSNRYRGQPPDPADRLTKKSGFFLSPRNLWLTPISPSLNLLGGIQGGDIVTVCRVDLTVWRNIWGKKSPEVTFVW